MNFTISIKQLRLSQNESIYIEKLVKKVMNLCPWDEPDLPLLEIVIRRHKTKSLNHLETRLIAEGSIAPLPGHEIMDNPVYFDGTIDLILPKKRIIAKMLGKTVQEAVKDGFDELFRELDKYKGFNFVNDSEYYNHASMRNNKG